MKYAVNNPEVYKFLKEILFVCQKHNMSISHQDNHGAFIIIDYDRKINEWLLEAYDKTKEGNKL